MACDRPSRIRLPFSRRVPICALYTTAAVALLSPELLRSLDGVGCRRGVALLLGVVERVSLVIVLPANKWKKKKKKRRRKRKLCLESFSRLDEPASGKWPVVYCYNA